MEFAFNWFRERDATGSGKEPSPAVTGDATAPRDWVPPSDSAADGTGQSLKDLHPTHDFDYEAMVRDLGEEIIPVIRKSYDGTVPLQEHMTFRQFIAKHWRKCNSQKYLHQWQFPLSEGAGGRLCRRSRPLPVLDEDMLSSWLDLPQCSGDSPLQYLFMGAKQTYTEIHRDNGGLDILIAPLYGKKECTLVHRDDSQYIYRCNASLERPDLVKHPLLINARIWKTILSPGDILLLPYGTYHMCRNLTKCLSYSRFHLDIVNLPGFMRSFFDQDAPEIEHHIILWNYTTKCINTLDNITDESRTSTVYDEEIIQHEKKVVSTLTLLRHTVQDIVNKLSSKEQFEEKKNDFSFADRKDDVSILVKEWFQLLNDIDVSLHENRYKFISRKKPRVPRLQALLDANMGQSDSIDTLPQTKTKSIPPSAVDTATPSFSYDQLYSLDLNAGIDQHFYYRLNGTWHQARVIDTVPNKRAVLVSYEDFPSDHDEYLTLESVTVANRDGLMNFEEVVPETVLRCRWGNDAEIYYAKLIKKVCSNFVRVEFPKLGRDLDRWVLPEELHTRPQDGK
uniref:JmjC domain-containing protein n=1 Tax=Corethron hystrix TaxID=216773 RepID=A0A7S1BU11_9STRA|mmetsp:Transcript_38759/g.90100  ORF Transcript_38759/g.90100 Transcript_38759/m.90100 type:complete len:564 (+) Transcript_38759:1314-3005(+)